MTYQVFEDLKKFYFMDDYFKRKTLNYDCSYIDGLQFKKKDLLLSFEEWKYIVTKNCLKWKIK